MFGRLTLLVAISAILFWPLNAIAQDNPITTTRDERLTKLVADQQISLDDATKDFVVSKCQPAQSILYDIQLETDKLIKLRLDVYGGIQDDLQAVKLRMERQGADSSEADLLAGKIQQSLDKFTVQANEYAIALDDVIDVGCQQQPEQFKAGLIYMRLQRSELLNCANDLKDIISNADNSTFEPLKRRLSI
jgi:hypothetical protein